MKKQIIVGISVIACVALCAAVRQQSADVGDLPAEPEKTAVAAEINARSEEMSHIFISANITPPVTEAVTESNSPEMGITAEKETEKPAPTQMTQQAKSTASSSEPHNGDVRVVDGERQVYFLGFGWIKDESDESYGTFAADMYENGNKICVMGGGTMIGNLGDQLTGHKVGIMGGGTTVDGKGDINKQVGIMGGEECPSSAPASPPAKQPEITGDVIYTELQLPVTKDSTPPAYKPNGEPYNP